MTDECVICDFTIPLAFYVICGMILPDLGSILARRWGVWVEYGKDSSVVLYSSVSYDVCAIQHEVLA